MEWDLQAWTQGRTSFSSHLPSQPIYLQHSSSVGPPPPILPGHWGPAPPHSPFTEAPFVPGLWLHGTNSRQPIRCQAETMEEQGQQRFWYYGGGARGDSAGEWQDRRSFNDCRGEQANGRACTAPMGWVRQTAGPVSLLRGEPGKRQQAGSSGRGLPSLIPPPCGCPASFLQPDGLLHGFQLSPLLCLISPLQELHSPCHLSALPLQVLWVLACKQIWQPS